MWVIYRDAVSQAGSVAAFKEIKGWIMTKKIQGEEAADVIGAVASSLYVATKENMNEFFELAFSPEVVEQKYLNTTALLAATKFIRSGKENIFIVDKVIPRLSQELKQAIQNGDSSKAQVYLRVLGNLAHPDILKVFAPYLDGRIAVTKYIRSQMVIALKPLSNLKDKDVRAVLFSILKNTAEPYEVRVAAALNIFMTFPTAEMMQIMAHMTNDDPSNQVRSVLANGINFAAKLKDPRFAELAKTAQAVLNLVAKEKFGYHHSTESLIEEYSSSDDITHLRELSYIGSKNHFLPLYHRAGLRLGSNGWTEEDWITLSVSDLQLFIEHCLQFLQSGAYKPTFSDIKFTAKKVAEILNIKYEAQDPLEGAIFIDNLNQQTLFTFTEQELNELIWKYIRLVQTMSAGFGFEFTKLANKKQVFVTFPLAAGVPFVYAYNEPHFFTAKRVPNNINSPPKGNRDVEFEFQITYARNMEGNLGFLDPINGSYASSGVVNKLQVNIPVKFRLDINPKQVTLKFDLPEEDFNFIHLSVRPYTSLQKVYTPLTVFEDPTTKPVDRPAQVLSTEVNLGQYVGVGLRLKAHSYSTDFKKNLFGSDLLTNIRNLLYQKDIAYTHISLKYLAKETTNKNVNTVLFFNELLNQKQDGEMGPASIITNTTVEGRRLEIVKRIASGIDSAKVWLVDVSAVFEGGQKAEYVFTAGLANSAIDNKANAAIYANWGKQFNAVFKVIKPKIVPLNFEQALKNDLKVIYEANFKYGDNDNVQFNGIGVRSELYTETLKNDPMAKRCLQDTSNNNLYQMDCYKMIMKAHAPDYFKGTVKHKAFCPVALSASYKFYEFLKDIYKWEQEEDVLQKTVEGQFDMEAQAFYYDNYFNLAFTTKYGTLRVKNVEGLDHFPYGMAIYAPISYWERAENVYSGYQYLPYCAVDSSKVWTFSGHSYNYSLTSSWHVVMVDDAKDFIRNDLVILARRPNNNEEEVYISYQTITGGYLDIMIKPTTVEVKTNGNKMTEGKYTSYLDHISDDLLLEYYTLAEGVQVFSLNKGGVRIVYDSQRLVIFTDEHRGTTRGLCGQSSTEVYDDYMTPYGLVDVPEYYGASFSLDDEFSDPKTVELKKEAKLKAYQPVTKYTNILQSDMEWSKAENESVK